MTRRPDDIVYFELFWNLRDPGETMHIVTGPSKGEGPWKIDNTVICMLACHGSDGALARLFDERRNCRTEHSDHCPERPFIEAIACRLGAVV